MRRGARSVMHDHNQRISIIPDSCPFLSICALEGMGLVSFAQITVKKYRELLDALAGSTIVF